MGRSRLSIAILSVFGGFFSQGCTAEQLQGVKHDLIEYFNNEVIPDAKEAAVKHATETLLPKLTEVARQEGGEKAGEYLGKAIAYVDSVYPKAADLALERLEQKLKEEQEKHLKVLAALLKDTPKGVLIDPLTKQEKVVPYDLKDFDSNGDGEYDEMEVAKMSQAINDYRFQVMAEAQAKGDTETARTAEDEIKTAGLSAGMLGVLMVALYGVRKAAQRRKNGAPGNSPSHQPAPPV